MCLKFSKMPKFGGWKFCGYRISVGHALAAESAKNKNLELVPKFEILGIVIRVTKKRIEGQMPN